MDSFGGLFHSILAPATISIVRFILTLLIAFIVGQLNAWCYKWTHRGVS